MSLTSQEALDKALEHAGIVGKELDTDAYSHISPNEILQILEQGNYPYVVGLRKGCGSLGQIISQLKLIVMHENRRKISAVLSPIPSKVILSLPAEEAVVEEPRPSNEANVA